MKSTEINAPPLELDNGDDRDRTVEQFAGLRRHGVRPIPLQEEAKKDLKRTAETSPLITTRTCHPTPRPHPMPPEKVIRDGYSIPRHDHEILEQLAEQTMRAGYNIGKSGILRLGVRVLAEMDKEQFIKLASQLPPVPSAKKKR